MEHTLHCKQLYEVKIHARFTRPLRLSTQMLRRMRHTHPYLTDQYYGLLRCPDLDGYRPILYGPDGYECSEVYVRTGGVDYYPYGRNSAGKSAFIGRAEIRGVANTLIQIANERGW